MDEDGFIAPKSKSRVRSEGRVPESGGRGGHSAGRGRGGHGGGGGAQGSLDHHRFSEDRERMREEERVRWLHQPDPLSHTGTHEDFIWHMVPITRAAPQDPPRTMFIVIGTSGRVVIILLTS